MTGLLEILKEFETAEDFLEHFAIPYEPRVVEVNRLHILRRLHDRLAVADIDAMDDARLHETFSAFLARAYQDFVVSDARAEKVFKVFNQAGRPADAGGKTVIPLGQVRGLARPDGP